MDVRMFSDVNVSSLWSASDTIFMVYKNLKTTPPQVQETSQAACFGQEQGVTHLWYAACRGTAFDECGTWEWLIIARKTLAMVDCYVDAQ